MAETQVVIDRRFRGPPNSGNGGYCAGLLAERIAGGPERAEGDGLRIFPGAKDDGQAVAAPFVPARSLADSATGCLQLAHAWAALDCPGYFAAAAGEEAVLGRMSRN